MPARSSIGFFVAKPESEPNRVKIDPPQRKVFTLAEQVERARAGSAAVKAGHYYLLDDIDDDDE